MKKIDYKKKLSSIKKRQLTKLLNQGNIDYFIKLVNHANLI
jgi:hypothetical protein